MDAGQFDQLAATLGASGAVSRRAVVAGVLVGALGILAGVESSARKRKKKGKGKGNDERCSENQTRCNGKCVNTNTDANHCGSCGHQCASGEECLNGACFSQDICPAEFEACPDFKRCSIDDSDCFCGTTTGGQTVCFQDEDFCETPVPCVTTADCAGGRVCLDSIGCCEARDLPAVNRTCVLPCKNLAAASDLAKSASIESGSKKSHKGKRGKGGPGKPNHR